MPVRHSLKLAGVLLAWSAFAAAQVQEVPPAPRFDIQRFNVDGNTLLPQAEVDSMVAPFAGKSRDFGDVQRALEALSDAYIARGYSAVRVLIPEQDLRAGEVRIQVIEARLREIRVEGNRYFGEANVRASLPTLKVGESPNTRQMSENLQLLNENPAKQATVLLEPTDAPGVTDAVIKVTDDVAQRLSVSLDNTGTPKTGSLRAGFGYLNANAFNRDHVFTAQYLTAPANVNNVKILAAAYRAPVYEWNGVFDLLAAYSDVNSGTISLAGSSLAVSGSGTILGARYTQILRHIDAYEQKLTVGLDYKAFKQNLVPVGGGPNLLSDVTVHPVLLTYTGRLSKVGTDITGVVSHVRNLPGGSDGTQEAFTLARPGVPSTYRLWRFAGAWSELLPKEYLARLAFNAQYTRDPLIPGEQFGMGGQDSVRGFYEREAANDRGFRISGEIYTPDFGTRIGADWRARALAFVEAAHGADRNPVRATEGNLSSVGVGLRANLGKSLSARADFAQVLHQSLARPDNRNRAHLGLINSF